MAITRRSVLTASGAPLAPRLGPKESRQAPVYRADWESLVAGYRAPDWYRDAKFGIWAHWGPQCVPEAGDWYAREMYIQGSDKYRFHCDHYGHPSRVGFLEIIGRWKAERWDPARLAELYERAGARYIVALANHHDNFDTYASAHHDWNATKIGPKRDIVGGWASAARRRGLRFGVSNHSAHAWHWYQPAYGYDPEGPLRGVRYDAAQLGPADGEGRWWAGLDPQQLYTGAAMAMPDGVGSVLEANARHERTDRLWREQPPTTNPDFVRRWTLRCRDLIDGYRPDLLYFDDFGLPLGQAGLYMAAHHYNASTRWHGRNEAVINAKMLPPERRSALVEDVERGGKAYTDIFPWQTCTCLGNWHYDRALYEADGYKSARSVIHTLCDVVSKNGNLLLSVPIRGDGTIDDKEERILADLAAWMGRYGPALYGSRPWRFHGEGPTQGAAGMFAEITTQDDYGPADVRYIVKDRALHAIVLGWPRDGVARLTLLAQGHPVGRGEVARVAVFGDQTPLRARRTDQALEIDVPAAMRNETGFVLRLDGQGLVDAA